MLWLLCTAAHGAAEHAHTLTWADAIDTAARASAASRMMVVVLMLLVVGYLQGGATAAAALVSVPCRGKPKPYEAVLGQLKLG
jgi:hypothetical protein